MHGLDEKQQRKAIWKGFWQEVMPELLLEQPESGEIFNRPMRAYQAVAKREQRHRGMWKPWS